MDQDDFRFAQGWMSGAMAMDYFEQPTMPGYPAILYVDDEEMARKYFVQAFGGEHPILAAPDAGTAIRLLRDPANRIGIVVTDYRMPGPSGGELLRQLVDEFPHIVRILVTAYADLEMLLETVNDGEVFRILEKPLDMGEARDVLSRAGLRVLERNARQQRLYAMEETLAFLAHELNTPLAAIVNFSGGIQQRMTAQDMSSLHPSDIDKAARAIGDNARYCMTLLSSFVRSVQRAGVLPAHSYITARQMIVALLDSYPLSVVQRSAIHIDIRRDFAITAQPNCVALVLSSLLGNALRAVRNQAEQQIRFTVLLEGNPQIQIADNGSGIPAGILEHLLVDPITTHAVEGSSGWGLMFCKRIMQSFGGNIAVCSDTGTTVTLNFPITQGSNYECS